MDAAPLREIAAKEDADEDEGDAAGRGPLLRGEWLDFERFAGGEAGGEGACVRDWPLSPFISDDE